MAASKSEDVGTDTSSPCTRCDGDALSTVAGVIALEGPSLILRRCLCLFNTVSDVLCSRVVSRRWSQLACEEKWVKNCVLNAGVSSSERPLLWRHLADVEGLQRRWSVRLSEDERKQAEDAADAVSAKVANDAETSGSKSAASTAASEGPWDGFRSFEVLASRPLPKGKVSEIERDVHRTFPTHPRFKGPEGSEARADLLKVLRAVAAAEPGVGYCQGMNFMAAVLLINLGKAQDAFWMLLAMIDGYHFRHVFAPGVPLLPLRVFQFSGIIREHLPKLWRHLQVDCFSLDIFAHQCVITLFAYSIEPDFLAYVWDVFFLLGWKAVFRIGLGLLASLESRLLDMSVEEISRFMHQCKRHFDPELGGFKDVQDALSALVRFKVPRATLDSLQRNFQIDRWQVLLDRAGGSAAVGDPLPAGLDRCSSGDGFVLDANALSSGNLPPWRLVRKAATASLQTGSATSSSSHGYNGTPGNAVCGDANRDAVPAVNVEERGKPQGPQPVVVPFDALRDFRGELEEFDKQTSRDVASMMNRVADVERELAVLMRDTATLRGDVERWNIEQEERLDYKKALMEALQAAVHTSPAVVELRRPPCVTMEPGGGQSPPTPDPPDGKDGLVAQCVAKLNKLESELFEKAQHWGAKVKELEAVDDHADELREVKTSVMEQLSAFVDGRTAERRTLLEAGFDECFPRGILAATA